MPEVDYYTMPDGKRFKTTTKQEFTAEWPEPKGLDLKQPDRYAGQLSDKEKKKTSSRLDGRFQLWAGDKGAASISGDNARGWFVNEESGKRHGPFPTKAYARGHVAVYGWDVQKKAFTDREQGMESILTPEVSKSLIEKYVADHLLKTRELPAHPDTDVKGQGGNINRMRKRMRDRYNYPAKEEK